MFFLIGACGCCVNVFAQTPAVKDTPENWLIKKGKELVSILSEEQTKSRYVKLRQIAKEVFNQQEMSRLAMGRYWRDLSADQQSALQYLFFDYFVVTYGSTSLGLKNVDIKITDKQPSGRDILLKAVVDINFSGSAKKEILGQHAQGKNNEENKDKINQLKEEQERLEKNERTTQAILDAYVKMASGIMHYRELKSMSPKTDAEKDALSEVLEQKEADIIEARRILPEELQEEIKNLWQGQTRKSHGEKE